jgi:hypothetical protein
LSFAGCLALESGPAGDDFAEAAEGAGQPSLVEPLGAVEVDAARVSVGTLPFGVEGAEFPQFFPVGSPAVWEYVAGVLAAEDAVDPLPEPGELGGLLVLHGGRSADPGEVHVLDDYVRTALHGECERVRAAEEGGRTWALNKAGYKLGAHRPDQIRKGLWPWLLERQYAAPKDDLDAYVRRLGRRDAHLRPGIAMQRTWPWAQANEADKGGMLASEVRTAVTEVLTALGEPLPRTTTGR